MNALKEIEDVLKDIKSACIETNKYYEEGESFILYPDHTTEELEQFKKDIDFEYNNGFGGQELFGTLWFNDGTWSYRGEYDGSEWWQHNKLPDFPTRR